jgi:HSP20 family protein
MREYMDYLFRQGAEPAPVALLTGSADEKGGMPALLPMNRDLKVDVSEKEDHVVVTADMVAGVAKKDISIDLVSPQLLEISYERREEKKEEREGYYMRERRFGSMSRRIPLPKAVSENGAAATLKNGVLEVVLKKAEKEPSTKIAVQ